MLVASLALGCFALVIIFAIAIPIAAIILRAAAKWVVKIDLNFGVAYLLILCCGIVAGVVNFSITSLGRLIMPTLDTEAQLIVSLIELPLDFIIYTFAYGTFIRYPARRFLQVTAPAMAADGTVKLDYHAAESPGGQPIGFAKAALVTLVQYLIGFAIAIVIGVVIFIVILATGYRVR